QRVLVVGGGQSAIESAALLHELGVEVELVTRAPQLRWLLRSGWLHTHAGSFKRLLYHPTDVGPPGLNQIVARPSFFRKLPMWLQQQIAYRSIRPAGAGWLVPRVGGVRLTTGRYVAAAVPTNGHLEVT